MENEDLVIKKCLFVSPWESRDNGDYLEMGPLFSLKIFTLSTNLYLC